MAFEWPSWTATLPMMVWLLAFGLLIVASGDQSEPSVLLQGRPQESPTETKQQHRLHEAQELELEAEKNATSLFDQLEKKSQEAKANAHNTALAARVAKLLTSAVDGALAGLRKQAQASIESSLVELGEAVANLTSNNSVVTEQAIQTVQSKFKQVQQKMKALQELNNDELTALRKGYELARRTEKNNDKSLAKEVSHAVKAWKRAGQHNMKEQMHAGVPEQVYEKHYGEVENSSEHLMEKVSDLGTDVELGVEKFFEHVEMRVEACAAEKRNELNSKLNEYNRALLQSQSRFLQGRPQESPTETKQQHRLHEAQELELEAEKNATSLFDQLQKKSQEAKANAHNTALAARVAKLLTSAVDGALAGRRKQAQASIESSLVELGEAVANLTSNNSVVTEQAIQTVQSKFKQVQQKMKALQEMNNDELTALRKGYELARRTEKNNDKSLAKEVSHAVKAWKRAGQHNMKEQMHAGVPEQVYEKHYGEVEHSSEHLMEKVSDLGLDVELGVEKFFEHVEMRVEACAAEKRNELNSKLNEYNRALLQSQSRFEKAAMKTYSSQPASVGDLRGGGGGGGGGRSVQLKNTAGAAASSTAMTEAAAMMDTANSWFGIPMLVIACVSGSVLVFVVDHLRFRLRPRNPVLAPLMIG